MAYAAISGIQLVIVGMLTAGCASSVSGHGTGAATDSPTTTAPGPTSTPTHRRVEGGAVSLERGTDSYRWT